MNELVQSPLELVRKVQMHTPGLKEISKSLRVGEIHMFWDPTEQKVINNDWRYLSEKVDPYNNALELTSNVRTAVRNYIDGRLPFIKSDVGRFNKIPDSILLDALTNGWFEEANKYMGPRTDTLLTVFSHVVKRIETNTMQKVLNDADEDQLAKLGLNYELRDIAVDLLDVSLRSDPLFVRFKAYSQKTPAASGQANEVKFDFVGKRVTTGFLFPHESQTIAKGFRKIVSKHAYFQQPENQAFKEYLEAMATFYEEKDARKPLKKQHEIERLYVQHLTSDSPLIVIPTINESDKSPYYEPQLRICLVSPESNSETKVYEKARNIMADHLGEFDQDALHQSPDIKTQPIKSLITLGGFGANLSIVAVAQTDPVMVLFHDESERLYDKKMWETAERFGLHPADIFTDSVEGRQQLERMSRMISTLHEHGHEVFKQDESIPERLTDDLADDIDEIKADLMGRAYIPIILEHGGLEGTLDQWAVATLTQNLLIAKQNAPDDIYTRSARYTLQYLLDKGAIRHENGNWQIVHTQGYFDTIQEMTREIVVFYKDRQAKKSTVESWMSQYELSQEVIHHLIGNT